MKYCTQCGAENNDDVNFCTKCGAPATLENESKEASKENENTKTETQTNSAQNTYAPSESINTYNYSKTAPTNNESDVKNAVMSVGSYVGSILLMMLPIAGLIITIVWACCGTKYQNKRNLARAFLILYLIGIVVSLIISAVIIAFGSLLIGLIEDFFYTHGYYFDNNFEINRIPDLINEFTEYYFNK